MDPREFGDIFSMLHKIVTGSSEERKHWIGMQAKRCVVTLAEILYRPRKVDAMAREYTYRCPICECLNVIDGEYEKDKCDFCESEWHIVFNHPLTVKKGTP